MLRLKLKIHEITKTFNQNSRTKEVSSKNYSEPKTVH